MQPGAWQDCMPERGSMLATKLAQCCADCGEPAQGMVPLGIHGDGVPVQGRMNQSSLDFITVNLLASRHSQLRVPLTCVDAKFIAGPETTQAFPLGLLRKPKLQTRLTLCPSLKKAASQLAW